MVDKKENYSDTVNLPRTDFPMKADLPKTEPKILSFWIENNIYQKVLEDKEGNYTYTLHDGPPYANGPIHIGHALNKIIKDIVVKYKLLQGFKAKFVPGWDCHGLPIEIEVEKKIGKSKSATEFRQKCREHAEKFIKIQKEEFIRLGVLGYWDTPYITMSPDYEAKILEGLLVMNKKGFIYRAKKPVLWCSSCTTALAEAEIEYKIKKSPSIYVAFENTEIKNLYCVIWTTTPWTIPANFALAFGENINYVIAEEGGSQFIVSQGSLERFSSLLKKQLKVVEKISASEIERRKFKFKHPLYQRESVCVIADFVSESEGTGIVHIAPGHGEDDFKIGTKYSLPVVSVLDENGRMNEQSQWLKGLDCESASKKVIEELERKNLLLARDEIEHSYPHCWRCKKPVTFRATEQWFIRIKDELRRLALDSIQNVKWIPKWGKIRMESTLSQRPDWCISRQRFWGVPIPYVVCKNCGEAYLENYSIENLIELTKENEKGTDVWFTESVEKFIQDEFACKKCGKKDFEKGKDVLDVWIDSGVSWLCVLGKNDLEYPADLYVEGTDQHRGWFQSSLLTSCAIAEKVPYKSVLTHGFILDEFKRKMSKSLGNVVSPQEIINTSGAEIIRMWTVFENPQEDIKISEEILEQIKDAYRKIRNTIRYALSNISDFEKELQDNELNPLDVFYLQKFSKIAQEVKEHYEEMEFQQVIRKLYTFCDKELSQYYFDIVKDRLYCDRKESKRRLSTQTVIYRIIKGLIIILSPILSFTAEQAYSFLPQKKKKSVFFEKYPEIAIKRDDVENIVEFYREAQSLRADLYLQLEKMRKEKQIGSFMEVGAIVKMNKTIENAEELLREFFIISSVRINTDKEISVKAFKLSDWKKCPRCWLFFEGEGVLCKRCDEVLKSI